MYIHATLLACLVHCRAPNIYNNFSSYVLSLLVPMNTIHSLHEQGSELGVSSMAGEGTYYVCCIVVTEVTV